MNNLIIIPARSSSQRITNKNLVNINGKPLIYYTINECKKLKKIADICISTDSNKIINYCKKFKYILIRKRPKKLSSNTTSMNDVILDLIKFFEKANKNYKNIILLQPTSPMRKYQDILRCLNLFKKKNLKSLLTISTLIEKSHEIVIKDKKNWKFLFEKKEKDKECNYVDGSIYICTTNFFKRYKSIYKKNKSFFYKVSKNFNIDIDYKHELVLAKYFLKENLRR
jgi:CMP-N-acetylneuraminic acid synthetase